MAKLEINTDFDCDTGPLWAIVGDPSRADWVPSVSRCEYDGDCRTLTMAGAGEVVERIYNLDPQRRLIEYGVVESAAPLQRHRARIQLTPTENGTRLQWHTEVLPDQYAEFIEQGMRAGIDGLRQLLAAR
ncbi:MAG: SRPBCC family protein [Pseudomonadales bacterium]